MRQVSGDLNFQTSGRGLFDITRHLQSWVREIGYSEGVLTVFILHTSASLTIQENADPDVLLDLVTYYDQLAPDNPALYRHTAEGPDDMPAHIRSSLTDVSLTIPVRDGRLRLGTWQGVYIFEHRTRAHVRNLALHLIGD
ncbi:secondary thiamine-phosphate synthase enzyme YjbQ [Sneathiella aquimaris]|uniref:secondary thiamine-phosphate synthase enzyme YjbQ n=1 Tax=Sneathiella aquimaris TaxID=2599305 RepID=UPI00146B293D|nr:secondary thiamine-phosphate synthase enzyme YjbQ [Sneathiella aquimaris]